MKDIIKNILKEQQESFKYDRLLQQILKKHPPKSQGYHEQQINKLKALQYRLVGFDNQFPDGLKNAKADNFKIIKDYAYNFKDIFDTVWSIENISVTTQTDILSYGLTLFEFTEFALKYHQIQHDKNFKMEETLIGCEQIFYKFLLENKDFIRDNIIHKYSYDDGTYTEEFHEQIENLLDYIQNSLMDTDYMGVDEKKLIEKNPGIIECMTEVFDEDKMEKLCKHFIKNTLIFDDV